jgi:hypothetical protein
MMRWVFTGLLAQLLAISGGTADSAASNVQPDTSAEQSAPDRRHALEVYVEQLEALLEKQAEDLASITPPREVAKLKTEHDAWHLDRDLQCAEEAHSEAFSEAFRIRELECLATLSELYFEGRAIKILQLKKKFVRQMPYILKPPKDVSELPGTYYRGDGLGYNISLDLEQDQTYSAVLSGCLGEYGRSSGSWSLDEGRISFRPTEESTEMKRHLPNLVVGYQGETLFLFPDSNDDSFQKYGPSRSSVFSRRDKKNSE